MIEQLIKQAKALLLFNESEVVFVNKINGLSREISLKYIDYDSLTRTLSQKDFTSEWYLSPLKTLLVSRKGGVDFNISSTEPQIYSLIVNQQKLSVPLPGAVIVYCNKAMWLYAYKSDEPLTLNSKLYQFPLPNIAINGKVCWGNVKPNSGRIDSAWQSFISSEFNDDFSGRKSLAKPRNIISQLMELSQSLYTIYPELDLVRAGRTLDSLESLKQVIN